jgi:orotidine-5'-phosphate decarboxylase
VTGTFGARLAETFSTTGHLCVGIDPHEYLLEQWGLPVSAEGVERFGLLAVDAAAGRAGIIKPQVAFFERFGSAGFAALEVVLSAARDAGLLVIADVKRGDLGTSVEAYAQAWLLPGSSLEADAMTISAYQGVHSLDAPHAIAEQHGKGLFVLAATSNPESVGIQTALHGIGERAGSSVAAAIVADVQQWNVDPLGSTGVVIGATVSLADYGIDTADLERTPILAPGFGHQGVGFDSLNAVYGTASGNVIVSSSRAILSAGPAGIAAAIEAQALELAGVFAA